MKILSFGEWKKANPELIEEIKNGAVECSHCDGSGESECFNCGHKTECEVCDGSGLLDEEDDPVAIDKMLFGMYKKKLAADQATLNQYLEQLRICAKDEQAEDR